MKKRIFIFFVFFMLFMWGGNIYASSVDSNLFLPGTSSDFYLRIKMQLLPLYLIFPDLDVRDEKNKPVKDCNDLFLNSMNYWDNISNIWGVIKKRVKIGDIELAIINLNKLKITKSSDNTRYLDTAVCFFKDGLFLKLQVILF